MALQKNVGTGNLDLGARPAVMGFYKDFMKNYVTFTSQVFKYRYEKFLINIQSVILKSALSVLDLIGTSENL